MPDPARQRTEERASRWRAAVEKVAVLAAEDETYLPIFAAADAWLREAEAQDPIQVARAKLARRQAA